VKSGVVRAIAVVLMLAACATTAQINSGLSTRSTRQVLEDARREIRVLGFGINDSNQPMFSIATDSLMSGDVRGERFVGLDPETRGQLFEVITVNARHDFNTGQTRIEVWGGMESLTSFGWRRVPSKRGVRNQAVELFKKLTGT
jgi:hypothetical protein